MTFQTFLIKYGEIAIKGKNRYMFEDALVRQIRFALRKAEGTFHVHKCQGRIYVDCDGYYDYEETVDCLKKVFGIVGICPVVRTEVKEFEELKKDVQDYVKKQTAPYKYPRVVEFVEELPKTISGKIRRTQLRQA